MKKRIIFICGLLITICSNTFAQSANFQYSISNPSSFYDYDSYSAIPLKGGSGYVMLYTIYDTLTYSTTTYLQWFNNQGAVTNTVGPLWDSSNDGYSMLQTADSGFIIGGTEYSGGYSYAFLLKTNSAGTWQWTRYYGLNTNFTGGGGITITKDGGYIIAGNTQTDYSNFETQIFVAKTNSQGDTLWTRTYGDTTLLGYASTVQSTSDGGFIITGAQLNGANKYDIYVLKIDSNGNKQWDNHFGGPNDDQGNFGAQTKDGGYIFAGARALDTSDFKSQTYVIKTDASGDTAWTFIDTNFTSEANWAVETTGGEYVVAGSDSIGSNDSVNQSQTDAYLLELSAAGKRVWTTNPYGSTSVYFSGFTGITQTSDGGFLMPGIGYVYDINNNPFDAAILVKTDSNGNISVASGISQVPQINPNISVYPNPFSQQTTIQVSNTNMQNATLSIYDMNGNEVKQMANISSGLIIINRANLNSGMYFYRLVNNDEVIGSGEIIAQ